MVKGSKNSGWLLIVWACRRMDTSLFDKTKSNFHEVLPRELPRTLWTRVSLRKSAHDPHCSLQVVLNQLSVKLPTSSLYPCSRLSKSSHQVSHQGQSMSITSGHPTYSRCTASCFAYSTKANVSLQESIRKAAKKHSWKQGVQAGGFTSSESNTEPQYKVTVDPSLQVLIRLSYILL